VKLDEAIPADLIVLASSLENGNCYIETGALDGEKNMKPKCSLFETHELLTKSNNISEVFKQNSMIIQADPPN